jgi:hypothetical protein
VPSHAPDAPVGMARDHLERLAARLPEGTVPAEVLDALAGHRSRWPAWPTPVLADLAGPPTAMFKTLDMRWLHRFEATVGLVGWLTHQLGGPTGGPSGLSLLTERAPLLGHRGWGSTSAGGSCRIVRAIDGLVAVNLPRVSDIESVPAWLAAEVGDNLWSGVETVCAYETTANLLERAQWLGLPIAAVGSADPEFVPADRAGPAVDVRQPPMVLDLSSMWAGPLCGWYLARSGADVLKVESAQRPDGGREGAPGFYRRLNSDKLVRDLELTSAEGAGELRRLVATADIVIEASRPRALEQFGVDAEAEVERGAIWVSITAHGRSVAPNRVGFGDDAAAAANLVVSVADELPWFVGDAAADPITGATAAALALGHWWAGRAALLDVPLAPTAALHTQSEALTGELIAGSTW